MLTGPGLLRLSCCELAIVAYIPAIISTPFVGLFIVGAKAGKSAAGFIKLLAVPCRPPQSYGKENIKRLAAGKLPRGAKSWPCDDISDVQTNKRIKRAPLSDFASQVLSDHPGLSDSEAKVVALTLLRCAEFASSISVPVPG